MAEAGRITVEELRRRMESGEQFTFVDVRNPRAWEESDVMAPGAIRVRLDSPNLPDIPRDKPIVAYCT